MRFMFVMSKFHQIPSCCHRWTTRNGAVFFMPSVSSTASCRNVVSLVPSDGVCPMSLTTQIWTPPCYSWRSIYPPPSWCLGRNIRNPSKSTDSHGNSWDFAAFFHRKMFPQSHFSDFLLHLSVGMLKDGVHMLLLFSNPLEVPIFNPVNFHIVCTYLLNYLSPSMFRASKTVSFIIPCSTQSLLALIFFVFFFFCHNLRQKQPRKTYASCFFPNSQPRSERFMIKHSDLPIWNIWH